MDNKCIAHHLHVFTGRNEMLDQQALMFISRTWLCILKVYESHSIHSRIVQIKHINRTQVIARGRVCMHKDLYAGSMTATPPVSQAR